MVHVSCSYGIKCNLKMNPFFVLCAVCNYSCAPPDFIVYNQRFPLYCLKFPSTIPFKLIDLFALVDLCNPGPCTVCIHVFFIREWSSHKTAILNFGEMFPCTINQM